MKRLGLQFVTLLLSSLIIRISVVSGLYFPQSNLTLRLPYLAHSEFGWTQVTGMYVIDLRTLRNDSSRPLVEYQILMPRDPSVVYLDRRIVRLASIPKNGTLDIVIKAMEKNFDEAVLEIKVQPVPVMGKTINCADFLQDMCFWNTSRYKIYENQPVTVIGRFAPKINSYMCSEFDVTGYELLNGKYLQ
ncbi:Uncharacterized protein DBV15_08489 [Temnothorax longispinosus]|uniref:Uncharacterized protein n=1 Tax=Temnothorax longispinosus TaxID=300112 RepID=A0A4S2KI85_9HYME|nr:Uncharacterized protein DBV15_08489 [Temnothorax longispinosus]